MIELRGVLFKDYLLSLGIIKLRDRLFRQGLHLPHKERPFLMGGTADLRYI
jgi:hypothetical protein